MKYISGIIFFIMVTFQLAAQTIEDIIAQSGSNLKLQSLSLISNLSNAENFSHGKSIFFVTFSNLNPPIPLNERIPPEAGFFRPLNYDTKVWGEYLYCDIRQLSLDIRRREAFRENE